MLRYHWRETWPGEGRQDWAAYDGNLNIGRVLLDTLSKRAGHYSWSGCCSDWQGFKGQTPHGGWEPGAWEAAKKVEDWYDCGCMATGTKPDYLASAISARITRMHGFARDTVRHARKLYGN